MDGDNIYGVMVMRPMTIFLVGTSNYYAVLWGPRLATLRPVGYVGSALLFTNKRYGVTWQMPMPFLLYSNELLRYELVVVLHPSSGCFVGVWYV